MTRNNNDAISRRRDAEKRGRSAERVAAWYLRLKGYGILARRFRGPIGEIDLVARRFGTLAFVEVKARADGDTGLEAVGPKSRARIARAAEAWLARYPAAAAMNLRFDVIVVAPSLAWPTHLQGAFGSGGNI
jgi:putative endonuclease